MADTLDSALVAPGSLARDLLALTKPRITAMATIVGAGALLLASREYPLPLVNAVLAVVAIAMVVAGAGAFNMLVERDVDGLMTRTRDRPLPSRRLDPLWALAVGGMLTFGSFPLFWLAGGPLPVALTAFSFFMYVFVYTPMKRTSPWALVVGAVPGAMPALMGSSVATQTFDVYGLAIFVVIFLWQLPHFLAIAVYREHEYTAAGHKTFPALWGMRATKAMLVGTAALTAASGVALWPLGVASGAFGVVAIALGVWLVVAALAGAVRSKATRAEDDVWARRFFFTTLVWQTVLMVALAVDWVLA